MEGSSTLINIWLGCQNTAEISIHGYEIDFHFTKS